MTAGLQAAFALGVLAGMRSMSAAAVLAWRAPRGPRALATAAALAEMAGDKMPFATDRRILPSFLLRLVLGAFGGAALAAPRAPAREGALAGLLGAIAGTLLGRAARGGHTRSATDWTRALAEDATAAGLALRLARPA